MVECYMVGMMMIPNRWKNLGKLERPHCSSSLEMAVSRGDYPQMTLIQLSEILSFPPKNDYNI